METTAEQIADFRKYLEEHRRAAMSDEERQAMIDDFKNWLVEHREQWQAHILDALPMEDLEDDWEE